MKAKWPGPMILSIQLLLVLRVKLLESSGNFFLQVVVCWSLVCFSVELGDVIS